MLRRAGFPELAEEALRVLPDPVDLDSAAEVLESYGVTRDELIDRMGGSPGEVMAGREAAPPPGPSRAEVLWSLA